MSLGIKIVLFPVDRLQAGGVVSIGFDVVPLPVLSDEMGGRLGTDCVASGP